MPTPTPPVLDEDTVARLAALAGYPPLDAETLARIAVGASHAVRAVAAHAGESLFDVEPVSFLGELERLAEPE